MNHRTQIKKLQAQWYRKLEKEGFSDIEDTNSGRELLKSWSSHFRIKHTAETFRQRQEYYELASHFLHEHEFKNEAEREIWRLHSEGKSLREIERLLMRGKRIYYKDRINKIVQELVEIMKERIGVYA